MENFFAIFPRYGKLFCDFSTLWKTFSQFFHAMENYFPQCGKPVLRPPPSYFLGVVAPLRIPCVLSPVP
jgi:hypothetical protein